MADARELRITAEERVRERAVLTGTERRRRLRRGFVDDEHLALLEPYVELQVGFRLRRLIRQRHFDTAAARGGGPGSRAPPVARDVPALDELARLAASAGAHVSHDEPVEPLTRFRGIHHEGLARLLQKAPNTPTLMPRPFGAGEAYGKSVAAFGFGGVLLA